MARLGLLLLGMACGVGCGWSGSDGNSSCVQALKKESGNLKKQKERMEMLCRTLTQERSDLKVKLRALGALPGPDLTQIPDAQAADAAAPPAPEPEAAAAGAE